jgi:predicted solute-binding protein
MPRRQEIVMNKIRIGTLNFLNVKPIFYGLEISNGSSGVELHYFEPWQIPGELKQNRLDLGIVPSIEYTRLEEFAILPGISISSKGKVGSVKLFSNKPLNEISSIGLDNRSRTSVALLKILCKEFYNIDPQFNTAEPDLEVMLKDNDAALLIGDTALYVDKEMTEIRDLSEDWYEHTGYPFVFAFMAGSKKIVKADHMDQLHESLEQGLQNIHKIAENHPCPRIEQAADVNEKYLTENICYDFGENELNGLKLFFIKAWENGLIDGVPRLNFFSE